MLRKKSTSKLVALFYETEMIAKIFPKKNSPLMVLHYKSSEEKQSMCNIAISLMDKNKFFK